MADQRTPLYDVHVEEGAKLVDFAGWDMPVQYESIIAEHEAVRQRAGVFDVSHMGRFRITGPGALRSIQHALSNDAESLGAGECHYSLLLTDDAGIADDLFVYSPRGTEDELRVVVNAANASKDLALLKARAIDAEWDDETPRTAMLALQGPEAEAMLQPLTELDLPAIRLHRFAVGPLAGVEAMVSRTGYTGEDGFEIITAAADAVTLWKALGEAGAAPCGLGARDVLRLEAAYPLWGHEIDEDTRPADAGLSFACRKDGDSYVGGRAHREYLAAGPTKAVVGLVMNSRRMARQGAEVRISGKGMGKVTSGTFSPTRGAGIAMAHVDNPERKKLRERRAELVDTDCVCVHGKTEVPATFVPLPFYKRS
jgi:aminomethyltransferase